VSYTVWTKSLMSALFVGVLAPAVVFSQAAPATVTCMDGSTSTATGSGACSSHGGVDKSKSTSTAGATKASPATAPTTATASSSSKTWDDNNPNGALAKCKDGTYWHSKTRSGTCSGRGGVDKWLQTDSGSPAGASKSQMPN
jgi:hypothetical protein